MDFYYRFPGDYARDTSTLSLEEHGAYTLLLDYYYATSKPLPNSSRILFKICRCDSRREQLAVNSVIAKFFIKMEDGYHNKKADEVIAQFIESQKKSSEKASKAARARWDAQSNATSNASSMPQAMPGAMLGAMLGTCHPNPNPNNQTSQNGFSLTVKLGESHAQNSSDLRARPTQNNDQTKDSESDRFANWQRFVQIYPRGVYPLADFMLAEQAANLRIDEGTTWDEILAGASRYKAQQDALGNTRGRFVKSPKDFFDARTRKWLEPFPLPEDTGRSTSNGVHKPITWKPSGPDDGAPDVAE